MIKITKTETKEKIITITELKKIANLGHVFSSETRVKILEVLHKNPMIIVDIAKAVNKTEANISAQISLLEKAGLIECKYKSIKQGVSKICVRTVDKIIIQLPSKKEKKKDKN